MKKQFIYFGVLLSSVSLFLAACTSGHPSSKSVIKQEIGTNVAENVVIPAMSSAVTQFTALDSSVDTFVADPTESHLLALQSAWKSAADAWHYTLAFEFGPVDEGNAGSRIWFWPKRIGDIEDVLLADDAFTDEFMDSIGGTKTGLPVMEFLIFSHVRSNAEILSDFTGDSGERYKAYIAAISEDLVEHITAIHESWDNDYVTIFNHDNMSVSTLMNSMVSILEEVQISKVGKPKGDSSGGVTRPTLVEAQYAEYSLQAIRHNIQGLEATFTANDSLDVYNGMDDYVVLLGSNSIRDDILAQFDAVELALDAITDPLWEAVDTQPTQVGALQTEITTLLRLIKVDLATALNETIYFTDSDGD